MEVAPVHRQSIKEKRVAQKESSQPLRRSLPHGIRHVREHIWENWTSLSKDSPEGLEETITCLTQNHKEFLFSKTLGENSIHREL